METVSTPFLSTMYEIIEEITVPSQLSENIGLDIDSDAETIGFCDKYPIKRANSDIDLSIRGFYKAVEHLTLPSIVSNDSLVSMTSNNSLNNLLDHSNDNEITFCNFYNAMESLSLGIYSSNGSLVSMNSNHSLHQLESKNQNISKSNHYQSLPFIYFQFIVESLDRFLQNQPDQDAYDDN